MDWPHARVRVTVAESLISTLLGREVTDSGPIRDCLMGANVVGTHFTVTQLRVDCQPCAHQALLVLHLTGTVSDRTNGFTSAGSVRSEGVHQFEMTKQVDFDGRQLSTRTPAAWVAPQVMYRGATTVVSGVPVLDRIGTSIAFSEAERRRPAAEQMAMRRVTQTAAPRFNGEVDYRLSRANNWLNTRGRALTQHAGLKPNDVMLATTDAALHLGVRVPSAPPDATDFEQPGPLLPDLGEVQIHQRSDRGARGFEKVSVAVSALTPISTEMFPQATALSPDVHGTALTILVHEEFVNHVLGQLPLRGREIPDQLIDRLLETLFVVLERRSLEGVLLDWDDQAEPEFATLLLDEEQPASIRFADGLATVVIQSGFRPKLGGEVPPQRVEIPYELTRGATGFTLTPQSVSFSPLEPNGSSPLGGMVRPLIQKQIEQRLKNLDVPLAVPVSIPNLTPLQLSIREIVFADGWLAIAID